MDLRTSLELSLLLLSVYFTDVYSEDCPFLCACSNFEVMCDGSDVFPVGIPDKVRKIHLTTSAVDVIPINAFTSFRNLQEIRIAKTNISTIRACSFAELENMTSIIFDDVRIDVIEGNAFSNMFNITKIEFVSSNISELKSYAFHNVNAVQNLTFSSVYIDVINPSAFLKVNDIRNIEFESSTINQFLGEGISKISAIQSFSVQNSLINEWHCGTLSSFAESVTDINISGVRFPCDCGILWLFKRYANSSIFDKENANGCQGTSKLLSETSLDEICSTPSSRDKICQKLLPTTPHMCREFFDSPVNPQDKVEYPSSFFTKPPRNVAPAFQTDAINSCIVSFAVLVSSQIH